MRGAATRAGGRTSRTAAPKATLFRHRVRDRPDCPARLGEAVVRGGPAAGTPRLSPLLRNRFAELYVRLGCWPDDLLQRGVHAIDRYCAQQRSVDSQAYVVGDPTRCGTPRDGSMAWPANVWRGSTVRARCGQPTTTSPPSPRQSLEGRRRSNAALSLPGGLDCLEHDAITMIRWCGCPEA